LPDGYHPEAPHLRGVLQPLYGRLWTVHRLDKGTSGVVTLARSAEAHRHLNTQFQEHETGKLYHALVIGAPDWDEQRVDAPLVADGDRSHRTIVSAQGKPAITLFRVLVRFAGYALVEAAPKTGRTHQIRAHLAHLGHPIAADRLYGGGQGIYLSTLKPGFRGSEREECAILGRLGLHAWSLELAHPTSGELVSFTAPYPKDFQGVLQQLRKYRSPTEFIEPQRRQAR
jgi:RluA family pseudouridine synthase